MMDPQSLEARWRADERWAGIVRPFRGEDVTRLRGSVHIEHTLARLGAERFWSLLRSEPFVPALGALTGNQAVQQVQAGLPAIYMSGWQVAADGNDAGQTYPDQSLYPADSVPNLVRRVNNAFKREDEKHTMTGDGSTYWFAPIVADAEAGFGGPLNAFELMKAMIEAGAAGVHFEDQLASAKKCGHLGGKVLVPTGVFLQKLVAARLAADLCGVPTVLIARTDANSARLITSDVDSRDRPFILDGERTPEGFHPFRGGLEASIARGCAYAPYADLLWCETSGPDLEEARAFADAIHDRFPGKMLAYNCSSSFNWRKKLDAGHDRALPAGIGGHGVQVPVRDARGIPQSKPVHVRARDELQGARDDRVRGTPAGRIRREGGGLPRGRAPDVCGHGILRRDRAGRLGRRNVHGRDGGIHREGTVLGTSGRHGGGS